VSDPHDKADKRLWHQSGVNKTGQPFVQLILNEQIIGQMTPEEARDHARAITEAAEAAEQDAFMMQFLQEKIGLPFESAGQVLVEFRAYRRRTFKSGPPVSKDEWVMPKPE
jgi:hypothetical protein